MHGAYAACTCVNKLILHSTRSTCGLETVTLRSRVGLSSSTTRNLFSYIILAIFILNAVSAKKGYHIFSTDMCTVSHIAVAKLETRIKLHIKLHLSACSYNEPGM